MEIIEEGRGRETEEVCDKPTREERARVKPHSHWSSVITASIQTKPDLPALFTPGS